MGRGRARRRVGALVALVALAVAAGCSDEPPTLDAAGVEAEVTRVLAASLEPEVGAVRCPEPLRRAEGEATRCTAALIGVDPSPSSPDGALRVSVTVADDDGALTVEPLDVVLSDAAVADQLREELRRRLDRSFQVDCGDAAFRVWSPGDTFPCTARDRTSRRSVDVTVVDPAGSLSFEILRPAG